MQDCTAADNSLGNDVLLSLNEGIKRARGYDRSRNAVQNLSSDDRGELQ